MHQTLKTNLLLTTLILSPITHAEVILDGTLGSTGSLEGPNFAIEANLGQHIGNNLFHSFEQFNLNQHESATFSGPGTINHVISRVTGGQASHINGWLRSTLPNADLYFLNPAGIMFGEQAQLDVQGSLHISTADYLRLGTDGRFDASQPAHSLLTVAPPSAFGFLNESPAAISKQSSYLAVPNRKTLSFIGGDLTLQDNHLTGSENSTLSAPEGRVNLVSVAAAGEVPIIPETLENAAIKRFGTITITDTPTTYENLARGANIDVSGDRGGEVYIRGGRIVMENAYVFADNQGNEDGQGITIKADELIASGSRITTEALKGSTGKGGNINLAANKITLTDGAQIASSTRSSGTAGDMTITATETLNLSGHFSLSFNGTQVNFESGLLSNSTSTGQGGQIKVTAPNLTLTNGGSIRADTKGLGDAGNISLQVSKLTIAGSARVDLNTGSPTATNGSGHGGTLTVTATEAILISGQGSALVSNTFTAGEGGTIRIKAPLLTVQDKGTIQAGTQFDGKGGHISVKADTVYICQNGLISTETRTNGEGGSIEIRANKIDLNQTANITTSSLGLGRAGQIGLHAKESLQMQNSLIKTETFHADGGNIHITSPGYLYLINSAITTSVKNQEGDGGNMIVKPEFIVLDNSRIKANATQGKGGNIQITTTGIYNFSKEPREEVITASSEFGVDGEITIDSPDVNLDDFLVVLPDGFAEVKLPEPCRYKDISEQNTFSARMYHEGKPRTPGDFLE